MTKFRIAIMPEVVSLGDILTIDGDQYHHIVRVLRLRKEDKVEFFNGAGVCGKAAILNISDGRLTVAVTEVETVVESGSLEIALSAIKNHRMGWAVQKLVELGVAKISPVVTSRTVVRPLSDTEKYRSRLLRIAEAAAKQCGRSTLPEIGVPQTLAEYVQACQAENRYFGKQGGKDPHAMSFGVDSSTAIAIGPEGGFSSAERQLLCEAQFVAIGLGDNTLRAETAAIFSVALFRVCTGRKSLTAS